MGWRVELRTMEVQLTDMENAAFTVPLLLPTLHVMSCPVQTSGLTSTLAVLVLLLLLLLLAAAVVCAGVFRPHVPCYSGLRAEPVHPCEQGTRWSRRS
jgi:hypothetical protein